MKSHKSKSTRSLSRHQIKQRLGLAAQSGNVEVITELMAIEQLLPFQDQEFIESAVEFANDTKVDLFQFATDAVLAGQDVFRIVHTLLQIFPKLDVVEISSLLEFLRLYEVKTKNDLMSGQLFEPLRQRVSLNPEWAIELEKAILGCEDNRYYAYLLSVFLGVSDANHDFGYGKIRIAYLSESLELRAIGLRGISLIGNLEGEQKKESFSALLDNADHPDDIVASNTAYSIARLSSQCSTLNQKRIELAKSSRPGVRFQILQQIQFQQGQLDSDDLEIVKSLCAYDLTLKGISDALDSIVYSLLSKNAPSSAREILATWVTSHSLEAHRQYNFAEVFHSSAFEILKNPVFFGTLVAEWLNADDVRYHHVLQEMVSYMGSHGMKEIRLDSTFIMSLSGDDILYVIRKILGFVHDFDISISLILSILDLDPLSPKISGLVQSVLVEHIGENYLFRTIDRIKIELGKTAEDKGKFSALKRAMETLQAKRDRRMALPRCVELMPNAAHESELNKAFRKSMRETMKQAHKKSVLLNLFTQVAIREGQSTFSYANGEYREPSKMTSISHGIELPRKDVLDEVGASFERTGFRIAKRGDQ